MGISAVSLSSTSATFTQVLPSNTYTPAVYELASVVGSYFSVGTTPYSVVTVNQQTDVFISGGVTWGQTNNACVRHLYVQIKPNGSVYWKMIGGQTTVVTAVETATSWKSCSIALPYRVFPGDQVRLVYYSTSPQITITPGMSTANSRQYPNFSITTNIR